VIRLMHFKIQQLIKLTGRCRKWRLETDCLAHPALRYYVIEPKGSLVLYAVESFIVWCLSQRFHVISGPNLHFSLSHQSITVS